MDFNRLLQDYESAKSSRKGSRRESEGDVEGAHQDKRPRRPYIPFAREAPRPFKPDLRVLVLVCAGPNSLHDTWFGVEDLSEGITLGVMWYGSEEPEERFTQLADKVIRKKGLKWQLLRTALKELYPNWRKEFDFVWFPDDDIRFVRGKPQNIARVMADFGLDLVQPCLSDLNITSPAFRPVVLRSFNTRALFHRTNCT
jgi:hypothetical protein